MRINVLKPFLFIIGLVLIVGLACTLVPTAEPQSQSSSGAINSLTDARNAVVQIEAQGTFIDPQVGLVVNGAGRGSGFIIDPSGIAVTNNHVVTGAALLKVFLNGEQHSARVLGVSECSDVAVIKIEGSNFPYLSWYNGQPKAGLEVYAAGFPLGEPEFSLTKGIISKEHANIETTWASLDYVLVHDATTNPGNSGGPLITADGQVVGINFAHRSNVNNQYLAIDAQVAKPIVEQLKQGQDLDSIGVNGQAVQSEDGKLSGVWVASVKSGSPADKAGIKAGDIIYQMEGLVLATDGSMKDYCSILRSHKASDTLSVTVIRFATGELLEGQLNGRELAITGKFDTGTSGGGSTGGTTGGNTGNLKTFTDQNNLFQIEVPSDWKYEHTVDKENNHYYIDAFTSPDGNAVIENIVYDDGTAFRGSDESRFGLYLLNTFYSKTGKEGDIRVTEEKVQSDGSDRLTWYSKAGGYSGISFLEVRNSTTFLMFSIDWDNGYKDQYIDILDNVISSYRTP